MFQEPVAADDAGAGAGNKSAIQQDVDGDTMVTPKKDMKPKAGKLLFEDAETIQMEDLSGAPQASMQGGTKSTAATLESDRESAN